MSQRLISRSPDLKRLQDDGYEVEVRASHLLVKHVPYRNAAGDVAYGILISGLELADDTAVKPGDHRAWFAGGIPHGEDGQKLAKVINSEGQTTHFEGLVSDCMFSSKPNDGQGYRDYHHKMTTLASMISAPARQLDRDATATTFPVITDEEEDGVFNYIDTATSRAGIAVANEKLKVGKVAIVGLGGTGSYILDFIAKTPVKEIHLFDGDSFLQHNAFRSPGAASHEDLAARLSKVAHVERQYSRLRRNIVTHDYFIEESNVDELREMDFVFIAADSGETKTLIAAKLEEFGVPFIDVGMGLYEADGLLGGMLRTTTSTPTHHLTSTKRISHSGSAGGDPYGQNIQIAELNALNAALAVIKWKKLCGFYLEDEHEHHALYVINGNALINEDQAA